MQYKESTNFEKVTNLIIKGPMNSSHCPIHNIHKPVLRKKGERASCKINKLNFALYSEDKEEPFKQKAVF